ncbi:hypothetical protein LSUE1_G007909 [Lachnellula suecica]|uniref:Nascent polypeptide-associated complex subunit alpha-like UBA domain-containing protein n=1 Tax=Lachnellula suecica TaxID=602035 RepID=A0A8T9BV52_9HELO|nr:hypothetical protein LSUE1_G007909 [Lachnellula suecica]
MSEAQPPTVTTIAPNAASGGEAEEELPIAKSAEDRKAAAALSSLDTRDDDASTKDVDQEAVRKAMDRLAGKGSANGMVAKTEKVATVSKNIKVDELELSKAKATEFLKSHDGDISKALKAYVRVA